MNILPFFILSYLFIVSATASTAAFAQDSNANSDIFLQFESQIIASSCLLTAVNTDTPNKNVFQLPPMTSTTLDINALGPITPIELSLSGLLSGPQCALGSANLSAAKLVFDSDMAAISPRSGLLRNSAKFRPAENVFLQIGLIDKNGEFTEINLNEPQFLNQYLNDRSASKASSFNTKELGLLTPNNTLKLGVRYVTSRAYAAELSTFSVDKTGSQDVTAGNVSVFLPFLLKLN